MSAPITPATLEALEHARHEHARRHELRGCHSCTKLWPDGTCRAGGRRTKDGTFPIADGLGCDSWDPIYAPGKAKWASPIVEADVAWMETSKETPAE
ncbi:MAG: hypothetical protein AMXMBFR33_01760 [Candidatus Xenobia bacterium]